MSLAPHVSRILVALDGSSESERALALAATLARPFNAQIVLLHATGGPLPIAPATPLAPAPGVTVAPAALPPYGTAEGGGIHAYPAPATNEGLATALRQEAEDYLRSAAVALRETGLPVEEVAAHGDPTSAIIEEAAARGIDLIVMVTRSRGSLERLFFGSTSDSVVRRAPCPVLLIRAEAED